MRLSTRVSALFAAVPLLLAGALGGAACATSAEGFTPGDDAGTAPSGDGSMQGSPDGSGNAHKDGAPNGPDGTSPQTDSGQSPGNDAANPGVDSGGNPGTDSGNPGVDSGNPGVDSGGGGVDAGVDAPSPLDGAVQGACSPGTYRCGANDSVEVCNSSGTAWLYSSTCAVSCANGLCTGACTAGDKRCNGNNLEQCDPNGVQWNNVMACPATCSHAQCDLVGLDVGINTNLDGDVWIDGAVVVHSGATLSSPAGNLTLHATSITVENGGSIAAAPTGATATGAGGAGYYSGYPNYIYYGGGGASYGTAGAYIGYSAGPGGVFGSDVDANVLPGSKGGDSALASAANNGYGGAGGGVLRLIANTIVIAGQVTAQGGNGNNQTQGYAGGGGGSGGGILVAGDDVTVSGSLSVVGGNGAPAGNAGSGGNGRVKILSGSKKSITGTVTGQLTTGLLPPLDLASTSHPDPTLTYNDDFKQLSVAWTHAFVSAQGYYVMLDQNPVSPPTPANGQFIMTDFATFDASALHAGSNYLHVVPVDATSTFGTVESNFLIQVSSSPPSIASSSHPDQSAWVMNANPFFSWTFPAGDSNTVGTYYVFDQYGTTVPTAQATFLPVTQKQQLLSNISPGVWVMHVVSVDHRGYLTKAGGHYRVNIGADPGSGGILGQVVDGASMPVTNATVTVNRGLYSMATNSTGNFNFGTIPAGSWEVMVTATGHNPAAKSVTVTAGSATTANMTLP